MGPKFAIFFSLSLLAVAPRGVAADPLDAVFARIDAAAKTFKGMTADVSDTEYTALVDDKDVKTGIIRLRPEKDGTHMLLTLGAETLALDGHEGKMYNPKTNIVDVGSLADKKNLVNQFLLLGFGATSEELKSAYDITYAGEEKIGDRQTSHLRLVPKSADTRRTLTQADLWFANDGLAVQQKFLTPSGNYRLVTYSNMKLGAPPEKELELKVAKGAVIQKH